MRDTAETTTTQTAAYNQGMVLLQTTCGFCVSGSKELVPVRVLLYVQWKPEIIHYCKVEEQAGFQYTKKESVSLNVFGSQSFSKQQCDLVHVKLLGRCQEVIEFAALCFPSICSPLELLLLDTTPYFRK